VAYGLSEKERKDFMEKRKGYSSDVSPEQFEMVSTADKNLGLHWVQKNKRARTDNWNRRRRWLNRDRPS